MIGFLKGRLAVKQPPTLMVDVNGVGYEMEAPMSTFYGLPAAGEAVALFTHLVVREDAHILYAFGTDGERRLFRGLLKISGVGPKIALGILSGASVEDFLRIVEAEDIAMLTRIPGIGRKTAERVIIEMRDSVKKLAMPVTGGKPGGSRCGADGAKRGVQRVDRSRLQTAGSGETVEVGRRTRILPPPKSFAVRSRRRPRREAPAWALNRIESSPVRRSGKTRWSIAPCGRRGSPSMSVSRP